MRAITFFRAFAWLGVAIVFWSLNMTWGSSPVAGIGPPEPWHRVVVGAGLLAFVAALALSLSGRKGNPPSWVARAVTMACAALVLVLAWRLYSQASQANSMHADYIRGPGWTWMLAGGGLVLGAALGALGLTRDESKNNKHSSRKRR